MVDYVDLAEGTPELPPTDGLRFLMRGEGGSSRVIVRPSGTEPKLKCYLEVSVPVTGEDLQAAKATAAAMTKALAADVSAALGF